MAIIGSNKLALIESKCPLSRERQQPTCMTSYNQTAIELAAPQGKTNSCDNPVPCAFLLVWIAHVDAVDHVAGKIAAPVKDEAIATVPC